MHFEHVFIDAFHIIRNDFTLKKFFHRFSIGLLSFNVSIFLENVKKESQSVKILDINLYSLMYLKDALYEGKLCICVNFIAFIIKNYVVIDYL